MIDIQIIKFLKVFLLLDIFLVLYSLSFQNAIWLLNSQVAFVASVFITLASFFSYKKNITNKLSSFENKENYKTLEQRDKIDEIDDPYDLYSEYEEIPKKELNAEKIKEIINEQKKKVKKNSFKNTFNFAGGFISIYRIFAYVFLIFGFFALNNNKLFLVFPFLIGLFIVPLGVLISKLIYKN